VHKTQTLFGVLGNSFPGPLLYPHKNLNKFNSAQEVTNYYVTILLQKQLTYCLF